ncbi:hypothetical protein LL033_05100 [Clostridium estertheticum]|uniref:hypothetical protein n=1 Tax=Clostridium estertheticum TaxID=238834 RepID=UPI001C0E7223|nr:hypothetical protein [Clostridium estertheticum]MBU3217446.1 hypothetical protein [Clostridium estertheticum]WAG56624.1 hypothetical protein LL033_05100 [Clostridium estertheticum]
MEVYELIKMLNNTEIGGTNTKDSYVYLQPQYQDFFMLTEYNTNITFKDIETLQDIVLRPTTGREKRLTKLGPYIRLKSLESGDKIILKKYVINSQVKFLIDYIKNDSYFVLENNKKNNCYIPWNQKEFFLYYNIELQNEFTNLIIDGEDIKITNIGSISKRDDSPTKYKVVELVGLNNTQPLILLDFVKNIIISKPIIWNKINANKASSFQ